MDDLFLKKWESIILKYNQPFEGSPEIDMGNLSVINHVDKLETLPSRPFGRSDFSVKELRDSTYVINLNESRVFEALSQNGVVTQNSLKGQNGILFEDEEEPSSGETLSSISGSDFVDEQDEISNESDLTSDSSDGSDVEEGCTSSQDSSHNSFFMLQDSSAVKSVHKQDRHGKPMCRDDSVVERDGLDCRLSVDSSSNVIPPTLCNSRTPQSSRCSVQGGKYLHGLDPAKSNHYIDSDSGLMASIREDGSCESHCVADRERQLALDCQAKKRIIPRRVMEYTPAEEEKMHHAGFELVSKKNNPDNSEHKMATVRHSHKQQLFTDIKREACLSYSMIPKMRKSLFSSVSSEQDVTQGKYSSMMAKVKKEDCTYYCNTGHTRYSFQRTPFNQCSSAKCVSHECVQESCHRLQNHNAIVSLLEPVQPGQMKKTFDELKILSQTNKENHLYHQKCIRIDDLCERKHTDLTTPSPQPLRYGESCSHAVKDLKIQRMKANYRVKENRETVNQHRYSNLEGGSSKMPSSPQLIAMLQELKMNTSHPRPVCVMKERKPSTLNGEAVHSGAEMLSNNDDGDDDDDNSSSFSHVSGSSKASIILLSDSSSITDKPECVTATSDYQDDMETYRKTPLEESPATSPQQNSKLENLATLNESPSHPHLAMSGSLRSIQKQFCNSPYNLRGGKSQECARLYTEKSRTFMKQADQRLSNISTKLRSPSPCEYQASRSSGMLKLSDLKTSKYSGMRQKELYQSSCEQSEMKTSENSCSLKYNGMKTSKKEPCQSPLGCSELNISDSTMMLKGKLHRSCQRHDSLKASTHSDTLTCSNLSTAESSGRSKGGSHKWSDSERFKSSRTLKWSDARTPEKSRKLKECYESRHQQNGSRRIENAKTVKSSNVSTLGSLKTVKKPSDQFTSFEFSQLMVKSSILVAERLDAKNSLNLNSAQMSTPKKQGKINMLDISGISVIKSRDSHTCAEENKGETVKPSSSAASNTTKKKQYLEQKTEKWDDFCEAKESTHESLLSKSKRRKLLGRHEVDDLEPEPKRLRAKISKMSGQKPEMASKKTDHSSLIEMNASLLCPGRGLCKKAFCFSCLEC